MLIYAVRVRGRWSIAHKDKGARFGLVHDTWDVWCEHSSGALLGYVGNGEQVVPLGSE